MGPFQVYQVKKPPERGSPRSRIPQLVPQPLPPKGKSSPLTASEEEEGREEGGVTSDHSRGTISSHSYCSDDTGCPTSEPTYPPDPAQGPCAPPRHAARGKRVRLVAERGTARTPAPPPRAQRPSAKPGGSEVDFSSSSSAGSLKQRDALRFSNDVGRKAPRTRSTRLPAFRPAGGPAACRDVELYAPYGPPPAPTSSTASSSASSPTSRRVSVGRYHSCGDNHGVRAPHPEQYLTPLQQKEVTIRHLKTKLTESENIIHDREAEVSALKAQLGRMREDWVEEECHRVEAQLSLEEARGEIRQLRRVVDSMRSSLQEKDQGIQRYVLDINVQNRKLEELLRSMGEGGEGGEEMADSGLLVSDEPADGSDVGEPSSPPSTLGRGGGVLPGEGTPPLQDQGVRPLQEQGVQTETSQDLHFLLLQLLQLHGGGAREGVVSTLSPAPSEVEPCGPAPSSSSWGSGRLLGGLVAVAAPALPTLAWLCSRHGVDGGGPWAHLTPDP